LGIGPEEFMAIGALPEDDLFHMTATALRLFPPSQRRREAAWEVSRELWQPLWPGKAVEDVPIGHVTNGVHVATWMASRMQRLLDKQLGDGWLDRVDQPGFWDRVLELDEQELWSQHLEMKRGLLTYIREEARRRWAGPMERGGPCRRSGHPDQSGPAHHRVRAPLRDLQAGLPAIRDFDRLHEMLVNPWRPVQLIFAGKAHPEDAPGKEVLQRVYTMTRDPRLEGRVAFIEDYEMHLAHRLVQGVDLWLNVPRAPLEACGTSGMKAALNSVPQLSTLDGWWYEGYMGVNGWALPPSESGDQDAVDAGHLYTLLEEQVIPLYYKRDARGLPVEWLQKMKHALRIAGEKFDARRMVQEYVNQYYVPAASGDLSDPNPPV
jgi:starch phosphorylase